jgi:hypothetical protein
MNKLIFDLLCKFNYKQAVKFAAKIAKNNILAKEPDAICWAVFDEICNTTDYCVIRPRRTGERYNKEYIPIRPIESGDLYLVPGGQLLQRIGDLDRLPVEEKLYIPLGGWEKQQCLAWINAYSKN